jgi:Leu/Phe-tRNA-protein transferase
MRLGTSLAIVFGLATAVAQPTFATHAQVRVGGADTNSAAKVAETTDSAEATTTDAATVTAGASAAAINATVRNLACSSLLAPGTKEQMDQFQRFFAKDLSDEEKIELIFQNYEDNAADALGVRGYMGSLDAVPDSPLASEVALRHGIIPWGVAFRIVSTLDEAVEVRRKGWDFIVNVKKEPFSTAYSSDLFFLGDVKSLTGLEFGPVPEGKEIPDTPVLDVPKAAMEKLIAQGAWQIGPAPDFKATFITPEHLARRLDPNGVKHMFALHRKESWGLNAFVQGGWVAFPNHGLHDFSTWKDTTEAKRLEKLMYRLLDRGYKIRFNHDYAAAIEALKSQRRTFRNHLSDEKERKEWKPHENRYAENREDWKTSLAKLLAGKGYSVEIYNEIGKLVAGEIGWRTGNHFYGDSPFYPDDDSDDGDIDLAKVAAYALMKMLHDNGMSYSDPGMITPYTYSMGAEQPKFAEFNAKMRTAPKEPIVVPSLYDPRTPEYFAKQFQDLERKKSAGLGPNFFVSRVPDYSPSAIAAAAGVKAIPGALSIVVVSSEYQASTLAKQNTSVDAMPVFVITDEAAKAEESATDYLKRILLVKERRDATRERNRVVEAHGLVKNTISKAESALATGMIKKKKTVDGKKVQEDVAITEAERIEFAQALEAARLALPKTEKAVQALPPAPVPDVEIVFYPNPKFPANRVISVAQFESALNLDETSAGLSWLKTTDLPPVAVPAAVESAGAVAMEAIGWTFPKTR